MIESTKVLTPADDISLLPMYYARLALNLQNSTDESLDEQLEMFIRWSSDEVATLCGRTFARERVEDTFADIAYSTKRLFLSHYPVAEIETITEEGEALDVDEWSVDKVNGVLHRVGGNWWSPVSVTYTGGYRLPYEAPEALQQACVLMIREAYYATVRGDATIRMVSHKESRVIYFDPSAQAKAAMGGGASGASPARRASENLLRKYMRIYV